MRQLKITKAITNRENASLDKYLQEIGHEELISAEEEVELARRIKFISYAVWWIRQSILQAIAEQGRVVRLPLNQVGSVNRINKVLSKFEQENERRPSVDEIADKTDLPHEKIEDVLKVNTRQGDKLESSCLVEFLRSLEKADVAFIASIDEIAEKTDMPHEKIEDVLKVDTRQVSVDAPMTESDGASMLDFMPSENEPSTDSQLVIESMREEIALALSVLNERERNVIEAFYGINQPECTMEEIGNKYGLTRERVRQIREKAIRKLKQNTKNKLLKAYLGR